MGVGVRQLSPDDRLRVRSTPATAVAGRPATDVASGSPTLCSWCRQDISTTHPRAVFCSQRCRQAAWRLRRRQGPQALSPSHPPGVFAYADPPFPGTSSKYYRDHPDFKGEVNHEELIVSLLQGRHLGWALSTSPRDLRDLLPLCPKGSRVYPWVKPGSYNSWEALIVAGGRKRRPGTKDWLRAHPARGWGDLMGRKPIAFCAWLFDCLGMVPGDELVDLFPGTGMVTRAWREVCRSGSPDDCRPSRDDVPAGANP